MLKFLKNFAFALVAVILFILVAVAIISAPILIYNYYFVITTLTELAMTFAIGVVLFAALGIAISETLN